MKKIFKKIVVYVVTFAIFAVSAAGMTVSAANTNFWFSVGSGDPYRYITLNKEDDTNCATVYITNGNLSNTNIVYIWMENYSGRKITPTKAVTGTGIYTLNYSTPVSPGSSVKFCVSANHYLQISGTIEV